MWEFLDQREREKDRETYNQKMVNIYVLYHLQETVLFYPSSCLLEAERHWSVNILTKDGVPFV